MRRWKALFSLATLFVGLACVPTRKANAQVGIGINIGAPPVCRWGYYDYAPYACAPYGFYGPGYFYNGIFLGVGPWRNWGYAHGWGYRRFVGPGGGRYHYGPGWRGGYRGGYRPNGYRGGGRPGYRGGNRPNGYRGGGRPGGNWHGGNRPGGGPR